MVFVLTLRDFKGGSLFQHLCKEVLPKHILSKEAMSTFWNYLHKIDDKVIVLCLIQFIVFRGFQFYYFVEGFFNNLILEIYTASFTL